MVDKQQILEELKVFSLTTGGLGSGLTEKTDPEVFIRLERIDEDPQGGRNTGTITVKVMSAMGHELT